MTNFKYVAKTTFTLPDDLMQELIDLGPLTEEELPNKEPRIFVQVADMAATDVTITEPIELRSKQPPPDDYAYITPEILKELQQRYKNLVAKGITVIQSPAKIRLVSPELHERVRACLPESLQNEKFKVLTNSVQAKVRPVNWPHIDASRIGGLFYLVKGNNDVTVWWKETEEFNDYKFFRFGDINKLTPVHKEEIQEGEWYVFDHSIYHSVETESMGNRHTIVIGFPEVPAEQIYEAVSK